MQDRKEFLKAVLRDEMRDRMDAEEQLHSIEHELGLRGSRHAQMLAAAASRETPRVGSDYDSKTVVEQYDEVMEELRYVTQQPVGSKLNIIRMHYLLEEQDRLQHLHEQEKKQAAGLTTTTKCST
ncbi:hypothetical protein DQ04_06201030 [Trypanosoma grayi]|uniref:hypothetical protein n=1 Tax=Trypanosoma grayi TaxID=71804 RepID=UPI0004F48526|nr:hypothetical protein DQ04_06201030 [Trypanosoma grayi]KEG08909.1 hypothetical protein DQ04_06201030 [Trypanosoma grayi]